MQLLAILRCSSVLCAVVMICSYCFTPLLTAQQSTQSPIIGLWQEQTADESDALLNTYSFYPNGTFTFVFNRYQMYNRIKSLSGKYTLHGDTLLIRIDKRVEIVGGYIDNSYNPGASLGWMIIGGKSKVIPQKSHKWTSCILEACSLDERQRSTDDTVQPNKCLRIFDYLYFKIRDNPNSSTGDK